MILVGVAVLAALVGLALVIGTAGGSDPAVASRTEARHGAISTWVESAEWLDHDHNADSDAQAQDLGPDASAAGAGELSTGFAMPATMMPGTPDEGFARLQLELSFLNHGGGTVLSAADFRLENSDGDQWTALQGGTFVQTALPEQHFLNTVVAFDLPERNVEPNLYLVWRSDGKTTRFIVSDEGEHH
jgi:hypothetical protein